MPQFFFHFSDAGNVESDEIGVAFATVEEAYLEAIATVRSLWPELLAARRDPERCAFEIANSDGEVLFRVGFGEVLDGCRPAHPLPSAKLHARVLATHERAAAARDQVRDSIDQVHRSLRETAKAMAKLSQFTPPLRDEAD